VTAKALVKAVVNAYVFGAAASQIMALFDQNVARSDARKVYEDQVIGNLTAAKDAYEAAKKSLDHTLAEATLQRQKSRTQTQHVAALLNENVQNEDATQATLTKVTKELKAKIIAYEILAGAQAARERNIAGEEEAVAAASAVGGTPRPTKCCPRLRPPHRPLSPRSPALPKVILPCTGRSPNWACPTSGRRDTRVGFDCSGLVQWAWGKAGIAIPRTTETSIPP